MDAVEFRWGDETLGVLGRRALWWARRRTLLVADLHLGKPAAFRSAGVPVPESATGADLSRLTAVIDRFDARRVVILGDLLHARAGRSVGTMAEIARWRAGHAQVDLLLIRGNHDDRAGDPPEEWGFRVADEPFDDAGDGRIALAHDPSAAEKAGPEKLVLCGHIHPAVAMSGPAQGMRAPCFWFGARVGVLPAFGSFTGTKVVRPRRGDRVFVVGGAGEVVEVGGMRTTVGGGANS